MTRGTIVALLPDGGWKYLSAGTFSTNLDEMERRARRRRQLVVSGTPGRLGRPAAGDPRGDRRPRPGRVPERGVWPVVGDGPAGDGGAALRFEATRNKAASPYRYEIHPEDLLRLTVATDDADEVFWAIVHSHTHTPAVPSPTDVGLAFYPEALYVLVSLSEDEADPATGEPSVRAWRIVDGEVTEVAADVTRAHRSGRGARGRAARDRRSGRPSGWRRRSSRRSSIRRPSFGPRSSGGSVAVGVVLLSRSLVAMSGGDTDVRGLGPRRSARVPGRGLVRGRGRLGARQPAAADRRAGHRRHRRRRDVLHAPRAGWSDATRPESMTTTQSNHRSAKTGSWVIAMIVRPAARIASTIRPTRSTPSGS